MNQPTYDDVNLLLRLYELRRETKMREARAWFFENFRCKTMAEFSQVCPPGSGPNANFRQFTSYWEMASSFVNMGVLNPEMFFSNSREALLCYVRVKPILADVRKAFSDSNYLGNLEKCAAAYIDWLDKTSGPGTADAFAKRVGG
jgi:hypothetical protein